jgi:hypothetical protein
MSIIAEAQSLWMTERGFSCLFLFFSDPFYSIRWSTILLRGADTGQISSHALYFNVYLSHFHRELVC